jgi:cytochrome c-type biogenesis protein CcmH
MAMMRSIFSIVLVFCLLPSSVWAVLPDEILEDSVLEERARTISRDIRCLVCQNQSIDDSDADLARDLRILVRERLMAGDSDSEVKSFLVSRYGDYVLLTPPMTISTILLWMGPFAMMFLGGAGIFVWYRKRQLDPVRGLQALSDAEQARVAVLLSQEGNQDQDRQHQGKQV